MNGYTWPDGTPKSQGNAFDWRGKPSVWAKPTAAEKVALAQVHKSSPGRPITIYSRAKPKGKP